MGQGQAGCLAGFSRRRSVSWYRNTYGKYPREDRWIPKSSRKIHLNLFSYTCLYKIFTHEFDLCINSFRAILETAANRMWRKPQRWLISWFLFFYGMFTVQNKIACRFLRCSGPRFCLSTQRLGLSIRILPFAPFTILPINFIFQGKRHFEPLVGRYKILFDCKFYPPSLYEMSASEVW